MYRQIADQREGHLLLGGVRETTQDLPLAFVLYLRSVPRTKSFGP